MKKGGTTQIKEIAEYLGVSTGTVSIVLNGRGDDMRISSATQQRVREAARELNYQPNIYARRLRNSGTEETEKVVAVFWSTDFTDDTMVRFFKGLRQAVTQKNYRVEFFIQLFEGDHLCDYKDRITASRFSGVIVSGATDLDIEFLNANQFDLPIVLMNRTEQKYHCVYINDYDIGTSSGKLFYSRNHKKVGIISMKRKVHGAKLRQLGLLDACSKYGIEIRSEWVQDGDGRDFASGYEAMQKLLQCEDRPTALYIMAPGQVLGTMQACKDAGISIPEDMEVLTYGDSDIFKYFTPSISSVHIPIENLAENALKLLMLVIENGIEMPMSRMMLAGYAFRESCGGFIEGDSVNKKKI